MHSDEMVQSLATNVVNERHYRLVYRYSPGGAISPKRFFGPVILILDQFGPNFNSNNSRS